jgi:hypothetical protein
MNRGVGIAIAVVAAMAAGCSSSSSGGSTAPPVTTSTTPSVTPTASPTSGASDLALTADVRAQLIHAYAQEEHVADSAYTGLAKGTAYYAVDNATGTYWAGASLIPSSHSVRAQVSTQDDGGYLLFEKPAGGDWKLWAVGLEQTPDALPCPVQVPADVLAVWHWAASSCNPYMKATPTAASGATNLTLTQDIRQQLVDAKAKEVHVPDSGFTGLYKGSAYYALDNNTGIYWAGASVVPSRHNIRAQVSSQDEGGYNIFERTPNGSWQVFDAGLDGPNPREGGQCPVQIPADVLAVWHWAPNTCDPPTNR